MDGSEWDARAANPASTGASKGSSSSIKLSSRCRWLHLDCDAVHGDAERRPRVVDYTAIRQRARGRRRAAAARAALRSRGCGFRGVWRFAVGTQLACMSMHAMYLAHSSPARQHSSGESVGNVVTRSLDEEGVKIYWFSSSNCKVFGDLCLWS